MGARSRQRAIRWTIAFAAFFVGWELLGRFGDLFVVQPFSVVLPRLWEALVTGELWEPTVGTLKIAATGFIIAAALGVTLGALVGLSKLAADVLDPLINGAYATPMAMLIPILGIYVGLEFRGKVFLVVVFSVFVIAINSAAGMREVPDDLKEMARSFGVGELALYRKIIAPAASPAIITGLRIGVGRAVQGAIVAELLLRVDNLGLYLVNAAGTFDIPTLLAATFFVTMLAAGAMGLAKIVEWWLLRWKSV